MFTGLPICMNVSKPNQYIIGLSKTLLTAGKSIHTTNYSLASNDNYAGLVYAYIII